VILASVSRSSAGAVEWGLIRHLYKRPLDTLLADLGGIILAMQQMFRTFIGPKK